MTNPTYDSVVFVDDNKDDVFLNRLVAQHSQAGLVAREFLDPREALAYLLDPSSDRRCLIFLDINMPYLDGFAFLERYRAGCEKRPREDTIVILTTSLSSADERRAASDPSVSGYLQKPLTIDQYLRLARPAED